MRLCARLPERSTKKRSPIRLLPVAAVLVLIGVTLMIPASGAHFSGTTSNMESSFSAASLAAPTGFSVSKVCLPGMATGATPVYQTKTTASGSGSSLTLAKPTGTMAGNLLIAHVGLPTDGATNRIDQGNLPTGWAFIRRDRSNLPSYAASSELMYKIAGAGEPANYSFALNSSGAYAATMLRVSGVDTRSPFDAHAGTNAPSSTSVVAPGVTTVADNVMLLEVAVIRAGTTFASPAGMTEINDFASGSLTIQAATQSMPTAGVAGGRTATAGSAAVYAAALVALRPSAANAAPLHTTFDQITNSSGGSVSYSALPGIAAGDLLIMVAGWHGATSKAPTLPASWTQIRLDANGTTESIGWWYHVVTGSEIWPLTFGPSSTIAMTSSLIRVANVNTSNPIAGSGVNSGTGTSLTAPAITVAQSHTLVIHYLINDDSSGQVQYSPGPSTDAYNAGNHASGDLNSGRDHAIATSTTTASSTWNGENSRPWLASTLAINPAPDPVPYTINANLSWTASASGWATGYTWQRWTGTLQQTGTVGGGAAATATDTDSLTSGATFPYELNTDAGNWYSNQITTTLTPTCP